MMFWEVFRFECAYQRRSPLFLVLCAMYFLLAFLAMASESVTVGGTGDNLNLNASFSIIVSQYVFAILGMFSGIAFVAGAITRDGEHRTAEVLYSTGVGRLSYLYGRFAGGTLFALLAVAASLLGTMIGSFMPWLDPERLGPFRWAPYGYSLFAVLAPTTVIICALFFAVAALTRSMMSAYVAALGFVIAVIIVGNASDPESARQLTLFEPFGQAAFFEAVRYWTVAERNAEVPAFADVLLYNRLIWLGVAAAALVFTGWRFRFEVAPRTSRWRRRRSRKATAADRSEPAALPATGAIAAGGQRQAAGWEAAVDSFRSQLRMDIRGVLLSLPFYVLLAFGILNVTGAFFGAVSQLYGTEVYPVTRIMLQAVQGSFSFAVLVILIYYSGELVHRERQYGLAQIVDAAPWPTGIMVLSKIVSLWFVLSALLLVVMLASIIVQLSLGYTQLELPLYLAGLFGVNGVEFYLLAVPAVLIQVLCRGRFFGMAVFLVVFIALNTLPSLDFEHLLYRYGTPAMAYSDMNGYGHYVGRFVSVSAYWAAFAVLLAIAALLLYPRGLPDSWRERLQVAAQRWTPPVRGATVLAALSWIALGAWVFYNTNVLNPYLTGDDLEQLQADYETRYKSLEGQLQPEVVDLDVTVDLYTDERRLESRGRAELTNMGAEPISEVHLSLPPELLVRQLSMAGAAPDERDERLGYYHFTLAQPLAPGAQVAAGWELSWLNPGFRNSAMNNRMVANGTFVDSSEFMPTIGYDSGRELEDNSDRRRHDLPPIQRMPELGDPRWLRINQLGVGQRTDFRIRVSTAADQIAVAPGYLQKEWIEGDRRIFEYAMDEPIWPFVSVSSARYAVARDQWRDVALEVYYHPPHEFNVAAMLEASKASLEYFSREFSPYQYRQFRILEFPAYASFAQSFPNTIPYSEAIGFIADIEDPANIDYVFYITAHELAHQWWAHQAIGAYMQGATVIVETLAQYSALMVMEEAYGRDRMRRFLKYELDEYLSSRGSELIEELPLARVENQGYIHYRKGSLVMYALRDAIGEAAVNRALRRFLDRVAFRGPPFPTSLDLIAEFRAEAAPDQQQLITDLFEKIVLFDLKVTDASVAAVDDGYEVSLTIEARKLEADGAGNETEVALDQLLDVGIFPQRPADDDKLGEDDLPPPLLFEKQPVVSGTQTLSFRVEDRPDRVGIDPYNKMIDRNPEDNLKSL